MGRPRPEKAAESFTFDWVVRSTPVYFLPWPFVSTTKNTHPLSWSSTQERVGGQSLMTIWYSKGLRELDVGTEVRCHVFRVTRLSELPQVLSNLYLTSSSWLRLAGPHWVQVHIPLVVFSIFSFHSFKPCRVFTCLVEFSAVWIQQVFTKDLVNTRHPVSYAQQPQPDTGALRTLIKHTLSSS